jgi:hypothetical protein
MIDQQSDSKKKSKSTKASKARAKRMENAKVRGQSKRRGSQAGKKMVRQPEGKIGKD